MIEEDIDPKYTKRTIQQDFFYELPLRTKVKYKGRDAEIRGRTCRTKDMPPRYDLLMLGTNEIVNNLLEENFTVKKKAS